MIHPDQMFVLILEAYPEFSSHWNEFYDEWSEEPVDFPYYLLISDLVRECSRLLAAGHEAEIRKIFDVVERWHLEGDPYVKEAAVIGFVEDLQNTNLHSGTSPDDFIQFLGPEGLYWWPKVERFWEHGELIVDDRQVS